MAQPRRLTHESDIPRAALCRLKAIASEQRAKEATDPAVRQDWEELAIEWHLAANLAGSAEAPRHHEPHGIGYYIDHLAGAIHSVAHRG
uniref:Uncharacterized protein n=1 Tax=Rhodopseudomonas palustris (strain BisA53) TaxID=316055 RepID=Q07R97_RHOP5